MLSNSFIAVDSEDSVSRPSKELLHYQLKLAQLQYAQAMKAFEHAKTVNDAGEGGQGVRDHLEYEARKAEILMQMAERKLRNYSPDDQPPPQRRPTSSLALLQNDLQRAELDYDLAMKKLGQIKENHRAGLTGETQLDEAEYAVNVARLKLERAKITLDEAEAQTGEN